MAFVTEQSDRVLAGTPPPRAAGSGRHWLRLARELPVLPLAILIPFVVIAVFASAIAPYDPTEPIQWVFGPKTQLGFIAGVEVDPNRREFYTVNNDGGDRLIVFSYDDQGNAQPRRTLTLRDAQHEYVFVEAFRPTTAAP